MPVCWKYDADYEDWRPPVRENCALAVVEQSVYLHGGLGIGLMSDLSVFDTKRRQWSALSYPPDHKPSGRCNHTMSAFRRLLVLFGGEDLQVNTQRDRICYNDVRYVHLDEGFRVQSVKTSGEYVIARRNHVAAVVGRHLLVHGGINSRGQYLRDLWVYDIPVCKWHQPFTTNGDALFRYGLAYHTMAPVFHRERKNIELFRPLEESVRRRQILVEGLYVFGGLNNQNIASNRLSILQIDQRPLNWLELEVSGEPPGNNHDIIVLSIEIFSFLIREYKHMQYHAYKYRL